METLRWITCLAALVVLCSALPGRIQVGGLFDGDNEEVEIAFRIAVDWLNSDEILLKNSRVIASIEKLSSHDSFRTTRSACEILQRGVAAIFGPQSELNSMHVQSICDNFEVPHIKTRWEYRLRRDQLAVNMYPHPSAINDAFIHVLDVWQWKDFFLVYEEDDAIVRMKDFLIAGEKKGWKIKLFKFSENVSYRDTFWDVKRYNGVSEHHIVLDVPSKHLYKVLKSAQQVGMVTEHQKYLITSLDFHTIPMDDFQYSKSNMTGLRLVQEDTFEFHQFLKEVNNRLVWRRNATALSTLKTETALIYDSVRLLSLALEHMDTARNVEVFPPISCLLMNKGIDGTSLVNFMKNIKMGSPGLSGLLEFDEEGFRSRLSLDVMYLTENGLQKIGTIIEPGNQHNITAPSTSDFKYVSLENSHFRVTTFLNNPYAMLRESSERKTGNERFEGFVVDVLDALAQILHFSYTIEPVKDSKYGRRDDKTGTWDGMIAEVMKDEADMAIADLSINSDRLEVVDFTLPFLQTGIGILFKKPTEKEVSLFSFLLPFSGDVWLLIIAAYIFICILLFVVGRMSPYEWSNPYPCRETDMVEYNCFSMLNSMWWAIGSLLQQGSDVSPSASSTRALTSMWSFFRLIMISSYTANLAAFLTVEKLVSPINSVEDLAKQDKIKYGCVGSGSTRGFFSNNNAPMYKKMYQFMEAHASEVYVENNDQGIEKVTQGNYAFFMEGTTIEYFTERKCNLTQVGSLLDSKGYGIAIKKDRTDLRNWLSTGILLLQEEGKLYTFKEKWWKQKKGGGQCTKAVSSVVNRLGLANVGGVILVMVLGLILSAIVGVVEFFWYQRKVRRDQQITLCSLFLREILYAVTCGSSSKPAPKLRSKDKEKSAEEKSGYRPLS